jgi:microcystin degradation protein MlrC
VAGIDAVLNSNRAQAFSPDLLSNLGINPLAKKILIVKSTNHFYGAFAPIASAVLYAEVKGPYPSDPRTNGYSKLTRPLWPLCEDPHTVPVS